MGWEIWTTLGWPACLTVGVVVSVLLVLSLTALATDMVLVAATTK